MANEAEWPTRKDRIDARLQTWGWEVVPFDPVRSASDYRGQAVEEFQTRNGPADYALIAAGRVLGIVEAKKVTLGSQNFQAERYARGVTERPFDFDGCRVPFLYSTNGEVIWFHDIRHPLNRSRRVVVRETLLDRSWGCSLK